MIVGKAAVIGPVPILGRHNQVEASLQAIDRWHDLIAFRDCQRPAGNKVVLDVYQDECVHAHSSKLNPSFLSC